MPQVPVGNFAQEPTGDLIFARGDQVMKRWDGLLSDFIQAGIASPSSAISVANHVSNVGTITGNLYGIVRYLDAEGRVSNVSPLSDVLEVGVGSPTTISDATNADPIVVTAAHGLSTGDAVKISGVRGNYSANGTYIVTVVDASTFELDDSVGAGVYTGGGTFNIGTLELTYSSVPDASAVTNVARKQIFRNKDGDANTYYLDLDTDVDAGFDLDTTSVASTKTDDQLGDPIVLIDILGNDLNQSRHGLPPAHKRVVVHHLNRLWAAVDATHNQGAVILTNGSPTVTGIDTNFTSEMDDWELYPLGTSNTKSYTVSSISGQVLTLDENYEGTTDPFARYELRKPGAERRSLWFSEASLPYSWDPLKVLTMPEDPLAGEMTGLMPYRLFLYILFEHRIYKFNFSQNPEEDGQVFYDHYRGCINQRCWRVIEGQSYIMDDYGIYLFAGNFNESLSTPIQPLFDRNTDGEFKIRWDRKEYFHCVHDPSDAVIRWFVCLDGSRYPRHALAYDYRHRRWWIEEFPFGIACSYLGFLGTPPQVFLGGEGRRILALGHGALDGGDPDKGTVRGTVTSAGLNWLADTSAAFDTSELGGMPVRIVSGKGVGQQRLISSATATKITVKTPWVNQPDTTSVYQVGGFKWRYKTGWMTWVPSDTKSKRAVKLRYRPTTENSYIEYRIYEDSLDVGRTGALNAGVTVESTQGNGIETTEGEPERVVDATRLSGFVAEYMDEYGNEDTDRDRQVQFEFQGVANQQVQQIEQIIVDGAQQ